MRGQIVKVGGQKGALAEVMVYNFSSGGLGSLSSRSNVVKP